MKVTGYIWLDDIVDKLERKHDVFPQEVHAVFRNQPKFRFVEKGHRPNENVYMATGQADSGRYLIIFFIYKRDRRALILSARDMTLSERKRHERK